MSLHDMIRNTKLSIFTLPLMCVAISVPQAVFAQQDDNALQPIIEDAIAQDEPSDDLDFLTGEGSEAAPEGISPASNVAEDVTEDVPVPEAADLSEPKEVVPPQADANAQVDIPSLIEEEEEDENLFFDADDLVPTSEMGRKAGPRKVNPALEPASKLIVVRKNAGANSRSAQLVAAERALKLGRHEAALEMYERLYAKNKRDPNIVMGRALALQHLGRGEEAVMAYQDLLDLRPGNVEAEVNMLGLMGKSYPAVALQRLLELREANPESVAIVSQIAVVQAELGRYNEALQYLGIAASMDPNNANHLFNIAVIADRAGNKKEAVSYYEQALEADSIYGGGRTIPRESVYERLAQIR